MFSRRVYTPSEAPQTYYLHKIGRKISRLSSFHGKHHTRDGTCFSDCVGATDLLGVFGFTYYSTSVSEPQVLENHRYPSSPLILYPRSNPSKLIKAITRIQTVVANGSEPEQARPRNTPFVDTEIKVLPPKVCIYHFPSWQFRCLWWS